VEIGQSGLVNGGVYSGSAEVHDAKLGGVVSTAPNSLLIMAFASCTYHDATRAHAMNLSSPTAQRTPAHVSPPLNATL